MTTFALSPVSNVTAPLRPVPPPTAGVMPVGAPPSGPPSPPTTPPLTGLAANFVVDLTEASRLASRAVEMLDTLPRDDVGSDATKDLRIRIYKTNVAVQSRLERQITAGNPEAVTSELRKADAFLEDANWQLAKKPSPDGRFTGVDVPGAIRDTLEGVHALNALLRAAGGLPSDPVTQPPPTNPGGDGPSFPPPPPGTTNPTFPPPPPSGGEDGPTFPPPPPSGPDAPPTPGTPTPGGGTPDADYPGEDEFPTDDKILGGGDG